MTSLRSGSKVVLMLDDNPDDIVIMSIAASELADVTFAGSDDPTEVLDSLRAAHGVGARTALLLDWHLPGTTSTDLLAAVRSEPAMATTYVVVNTGSDDPADRTAAMAAGASAYSVKPAGFDATVALLNDVLANLTPSRR